MNRIKFSEDSSLNFLKIFLVKVFGFEACRLPPTITFYYSINRIETQADPSTVLKYWYKKLQQFCSSSFWKKTKYILIYKRVPYLPKYGTRVFFLIYPAFWLLF